MVYPENCLRGIRKDHKNNITPERKVSAVVFKPESTRSDGGLEAPINWEDDAETLYFTLNQKVDDRYLFPHGVVRLSRHVINRVNTRPGLSDVLKYERAPLPDNPYHGNVVFRQGLSKPTILMIAAVLAVESSIIIERI